MADKPRVQSFNVNDDQGRPVRFTLGTDIIDYAESARAFGREDLAATDAHGRYQRRVFAIPDRKSAVTSPMVLSIGNQNGLSLIRRQDGSDSTAWKLTDLGKAFKASVGENPQVRALGVGWTDSDKITIAVSVDGGGDHTPSRIFVAWNLSSKTTDWEKIPWVDCGTREKVHVEGIRVLNEGNRVWTVVLAGDKGAESTLYLLRSNRKPESFARALVFTPAVTFQEFYDYQAIVDPMTGPGIAVVGKSGNSSVMYLRPFPEYAEDGSIDGPTPTIPLKCPAGARLLESGVTRNGGTDLYVGGEGVHLIAADEMDNKTKAAAVTVASKEAASDIQSLVVADAADGSASVWTVLRNGDLGVARRKAGEKTWGNPLRIRPGVRDIAPVQGDKFTVTSILVIYSDGRASFLWQDARTNVWQETPLLVASPDRVTKATCYGTSLRVLDTSGLPRQGVKVTVSASVLANVVVNRNAVFLGPGINFETETDMNGGVSIFDRVRSLTPAVLRFTIAGIDNSIDVNPAGGIHQRFSEVTPDQLRNASVKAPNGSPAPLLPESFRTGDQKNQLDAIAGSLNQTASLAKGTNGVVGGVCTVAPAAAFSSRLKVESLPANYRWGVEADSRGFRAATSATIDALSGAANSVGTFFVNLGDSIADFFEGVWNKIKQGWTFVVEKTMEGVNFICKIGDAIKRWVVSTLEEIGSFFVWLWEQVKTGLEKLWEWLKFIVDWEDILRCRDAMASLTEQSLTHFENSTEKMKRSVGSGFDEISKIVRGWSGSSAASSSSGGGTLVSGAMTIVNGIGSVMDEIMGNSIVAWVMSKLQSIIDSIVQVSMPDATAAMNAVAEGFQHLLEGSLGALEEAALKMFAAVEKLFGEGIDLTTLSFEKLQQVFISAGVGVLDTMINAVRNLSLGFLDLLKGIIGMGRNLLVATIRFPLIEQLVKTLTMGFVTIDTSFRLLDGMLLLFAIPMTIACKLVFGRAPFGKGAKIVLPFDRAVVSDGSVDIRGMIAWAPPFAGLAKLVAATLGYLDARTSINDWHTVGQVGACCGIFGLAVEIAVIGYSYGAEAIALQWIMALTSAVAAGPTLLAACISVTYGNGNELRRSKQLGYLGLSTSIIHMAARTWLTSYTKGGDTDAKKVTTAVGFLDDFAGICNGAARFDDLRRPKILKAAIAARVACIYMSLAATILTLKEQEPA